MKLVINLLTAIVAVVFLASCNEDPNQRFSCDDNIDQWIKAHRSEISTMDRNAWLNCSAPMGTGIYRAFSGKQKLDFWVQKIDEVLTLAWNEREMRHIEDVKVFITANSSIFEGIMPSEDETAILDGFFYRWRKTAIKELGWDDRIVGSIVLTGLKVDDTYGNVIYPEENHIRSLKSLGVEEDCNCNTLHDFCVNFDCLSSDCNDTERGCGWLLLQKCDGNCGGI